MRLGIAMSEVNPFIFWQGEWTDDFVLLGICLAVSFLLSGMEAGVFAVNRLRLQKLKREGHGSARRLLEFLNQPERFLWTILVGNTLSNFVLAVQLGYASIVLVKGSLVWFLGVWLFLALVFYSFMELLPKMLFRRYPNRLCLWSMPVFRVIALALSPLVFVTNRLAVMVLKAFGKSALSGHLFGNREELRFLLEESSQVLPEEERSLIERVLDLQNATVERIVVPWSKAVTVRAGTTWEEILQICREKGVSRLPVWGEGKSEKRIEGIVTIRAWLFGEEEGREKTAIELARKPVRLGKSTRLEEALGRMQRSGHRMAIVTNAEGQDIGFITLQEVLQVIFGKVNC